MSHVSTIGIETNDLESLEKAGAMCGLQLVKKETYIWYGRHVGDYPLPAGFKKEDLGKCDYVLTTGKPGVYEVGVVKRKDGKPGYELLWDFWRGGRGLEAAVGKNGGALKREYAIQVGMKDARRKGFQVRRQLNEATGKAQMVAWRS